MPIYEFECESCSTIQEEIFSMLTVPEIIICDECDKPMRRVFNVPQVKIANSDDLKVKLGDNYQEAWRQREKDEERMHNRASVSKESDEVLKARRQGRRASAEFKKHNKKKWERVYNYKRRGEIQQKGETYTLKPKPN